MRAAIRDTSWILEDFYPHLLAFHGGFRWVVLTAAITAIFVAISGWKSPKAGSGVLLRIGIIFVVAMDLEFLLGLFLYFGASPLMRIAFQNLAAAMKDHELRFFAVEHTTYMFIAFVLAHVGAALFRRGKTDLAKYRGAAICYSLSLLLTLAGIPWWRPLPRFGS